MPTINGRACVANGRNLIIQSDLKGGYLNRDNGNMLPWGNTDFCSDIYIPTNGSTVFTFSSPDYVFKGSWYNTLAMYDSDKNYLGFKTITSATQTLTKSNVAYIRFSINFTAEGGTSGNLSDWLSSHRYKLEKGSVATPLTPAPVDKVFSDGRQVYGRNLLIGGSGTSHTVPAQNWGDGPYLILDTSSLKIGDVVSVQVEANSAKTAELFMDLNNSWQVSPLFANGTETSTFTWTEELSKLSLPVVFKVKPMLLTDQYTWSKAKAEIGTTASPWTPAPEDVM